MKFLKRLALFLQNVAEDTRIPSRDKKIILIMLLLILSPWDFIPDNFFFWGLVDDIFFLALILDYFFSILDQTIILSHYPWGMKSFSTIKKIASIVFFFAPNFISDFLWEYKRSPF